MSIRLVIKRGENFFSFRCSIATALVIALIHAVEIASKYIN